MVDQGRGRGKRKHGAAPWRIHCRGTGVNCNDQANVLATTMNQAASGDVLFFIPDISGFTRFVTETEISHSQHIIKELLEALVDSNALGLRVSEYEGDAILFYRHGAPPSVSEFVEQARRMFVGFHGRLRKNELSRLCQCGACAGASRLTLKMIAHFGAAGALRVKDQEKFIGKAIIVAHRLLKNSIADREYLLLTRDLLAVAGEAGAADAAFQDGADSYDEIGRVEYRYLSLGRYRGEVKVEPPPAFRIENPHKVFTLSRHIRAPVERVYQALIDLPGRIKWIDGIREVQLRGEGPNRIGMVHRCVRDGNDPDLVTSDVKVSDAAMEFWETDIRKLGSCRYVLNKAPGDATDAVMEFYVRGNFFVKLLFRWFTQKKLAAAFERSLGHLAALCEKSAP